MKSLKIEYCKHIFSQTFFRFSLPRCQRNDRSCRAAVVRRHVPCFTSVAPVGAPFPGGTPPQLRLPMVQTTAPCDRPVPTFTMELDNVTAAVTAAADDLPLPRLLTTVLLPAAAATDGAYQRLDAALRADTGRPPAAGGSGGGRGGDGISAAAAVAAAMETPGGPPAYAITCANVTEDLKVSAEVLTALSLVLTARPRDDAPYAAAAAVVERLQGAEASRLVATVSLHVLRRAAAHGVGGGASRSPLPRSMVAAAAASGALAAEADGHDGGGVNSGNGDATAASPPPPVVDADRISRAVRSLATAEEAVRDVLDEVREMIADAEGDEAGGGNGDEV